MGASRAEAMSSVKKLCRTLDSAPSPHARARVIYNELSRAEGWSAKEESEIAAFGQWLSTRPPPTTLKARALQLINGLG